MNKAKFDDLLASAREMRAIRAGDVAPARVTTVAPTDPRLVRASLKMTQEKFAAMLGVPIGTLRNWEQGKRQPAGAAKTLLLLAAKHPRIVRSVLAAA